VLLFLGSEITLSVQVSNNPQLKLLPSGPPTSFEDDPSGINKFLQPYQDALAAKRLQAEHKASTGRSKEQQSVAVKGKKTLREEEEKVGPAKKRKLSKEESASTSTILLTIIQGHVSMCSMLLFMISLTWRSLSRKKVYAA